MIWSQWRAGAPRPGAAGTQTTAARAGGPWRIDSLELRVIDPELQVFLAEHRLSADFASRLDGYVTASPGASPDTAIALWQRFEAVYRGAVKSSAADLAMLGPALRARGEPLASSDPETAMDRLKDSPTLLDTLGTWRAATQLVIAVRLVQGQARTPLIVMHRVWEMVALYALVTEGLAEEGAQRHVERWRADRGETFEIDRVFCHVDATGVQLRAVIRRPA